MASLRMTLSAIVIGLAAVASAGAEERVNVNTADAATIAAKLDGVGLKKAEAIVRYRDENGRFDAPADLTKVKGIGAATIARNAGRIAVRAAAAPPADAESDRP